MICLECNSEIKNYIALGLHLRNYHNSNAKQYYDKFLRKENEGICPVCGKETGFQGIRLGYLKHCSYKCTQNDPAVIEKYENTCLELYGSKNPYQSEICKEKIKQTNLERTGYEYNLQNPKTIEKSKQTKLIKYGDENYNNIQKTKQTCIEKFGVDSYSKTNEFKNKIRITNDFVDISKKGLCTRNKNVNKQKQLGYVTIQELFYEYGQGWYKNKIVPILYKYHTGFVSLEDKQKIDEYYNSYNGHSSQKEQLLCDLIKKYYNGTISRGNRTILNSYELDIYIPELKIAFEYNGIYWHSTRMKNKNYHYEKSIACFNKGIRLIHIYEFEDWNNIEIFIQSIFNKTEIPTNDFNKYSPLQFNYNKVQFSKETLIYSDIYNFEIYGSGTFTLF